MSVCSRYPAWFGDQQRFVQVGSTVLVFGLLFGSGLYVVGIVPLAVTVAIILDHWYRAE